MSSEIALESAAENVTTTAMINWDSIAYWMETFWEEYGDERVRDYPLMGSLRYPLYATFAYYFFVLWFGPRIMKNRKPFSLKPILIVYNLALSFANLWFFYKIIIISNFGEELFNFDYIVTIKKSQKLEKFIKVGYIYLISKYIDKLDSIFFVLRKKQSQITGLHVYHHSIVPLFGWLYFRHNPFNVIPSTFMLLNTPIHFIMYAYYGLAAMGPQMQPYLWWKRYITQIQIFQFILLFIYGMAFCIFQKGYPTIFMIDIIYHTLFYLYTFTSFYMKTYDTKANLKRETLVEAEQTIIDKKVE